MSDLKNKLMEAGIIPEGPVKQMEQWQQLPAGSSQRIGQFDQAKVDRLKDDLELNGLPKVRETVVDAHKIVERAVKDGHVWSFINPPLMVSGVPGGRDRMGRLLVPIPMGDMLMYNQLSAVMRAMTYVRDKDGKEFKIKSVELLYTDKIPTHWFVELEDVKEK
jgi:hypothetical protein